MAQQALSKAAGDAVLQTAIQMEDVGRDFYEAFAATTGDSKVRQLCLKLATAECKHHEVLQQMRSELARQGRTVLLGEDQSAANRQKVRDAVLPDANTVRQMASQGDVRALLDLAVQMEQDSIRFYRSFIDSVPDRGVLEAIIREEQEHLRLLRVAGLGEGTSR